MDTALLLQRGSTGVDVETLLIYGVRTGVRVDELSSLRSSLVLCDVAPEHLATIARDVLPAGFVGRLQRLHRTGAVFMVDWAMREPIPWRAESCRHAGTGHVGGGFEEIAASEAAMTEGAVPSRPFVIVAQPSVCDTLRAPAGQHTAWGYCHVPLGSRLDEAERSLIEVTLDYCEGDKRRAAAVLGCSLKTLYNKLNSYARERSDGHDCCTAAPWTITWSGNC